MLLAVSLGTILSAIVADIERERPLRAEKHFRYPVNVFLAAGLQQAGLSDSEIAKLLKISDGEVADAGGLATNRGYQSADWYSINEHYLEFDDVSWMIDQGLSDSEIAGKLTMDVPTVSLLRRRMSSEPVSGAPLKGWDQARSMAWDRWVFDNSAPMQELVEGARHHATKARREEALRQEEERLRQQEERRLRSRPVRSSATGRPDISVYVHPPKAEEGPTHRDQPWKIDWA
jgi:transcriptional regulator with XRE-family HTH domain